eukprot:4864-Pelagomonas_calceolata.AAC.1
MSGLLDLLLAGVDQPQAGQPNSLAEGLRLRQPPQATSAFTGRSLPQSSTNTFLPQQQQQQQQRRQQQQGRRDGKPEAEEDKKHAQTEICDSESITARQ